MANNQGRRRRFGSVRQLKSGRWQARYRDPATGQLRTAEETYATKPARRSCWRTSRRTSPVVSRLIPTQARSSLASTPRGGSMIRSSLPVRGSGTSQ